MRNPQYSYRTHSGQVWVSCFECKKGINGNQLCMKGVMARNERLGCFEGRLMDKYSLETEKKDGDKEA